MDWGNTPNYRNNDKKKIDKYNDFHTDSFIDESFNHEHVDNQTLALEIIQNWFHLW